MYSFLRYGEDETLLVVINLSRESITDYALSADEGLLSGTPGADLLLGDGEIAAPVLNDGGRIFRLRRRWPSFRHKAVI